MNNPNDLFMLASYCQSGGRFSGFWNVNGSLALFENMTHLDGCVVYEHDLPLIDMDSLLFRTNMVRYVKWVTSK